MSSGVAAGEEFAELAGGVFGAVRFEAADSESAGVLRHPTWAAVVARDELMADRAAAARLIPADKLAAWLAARDEGVTAEDIADEWQVPRWLCLISSKSFRTTFVELRREQVDMGEQF